MELNAAARAAFEAMREGILIIDTDCRIVFGNRAYREFLSKETGKEAETIEGRWLRDLRQGARLPEVLEQGKPILHTTRQESKDVYFVNMYPIYMDGVLAGGLSVVTFLEDAYQARERLEEAERHSKQVLRSINKVNGARYTFADIVAESPSAAAVKALAERIAATDVTVLLEAESGTGKELYAQAIHNASPRREGVFVAINCANFNHAILESELFGYAEGAFTGAKKGGKIGLFEAAAGGTIFLDEISEMDPALQSKLLRVLQERRVRPVGAVQELDVDVRVVAACNVRLVDYVDEGKFRRDLYYRLSAFPVNIPPLRERLGDIPALARIILDQLSRKLRRSLTLTEEAVTLLQAHNWPGNVRELRNALEFSAYLSPAGVITAEGLPANLHRPAAGPPRTLAQLTRAFEKQEIRKLLERNGTDLEGKKKTAAQLSISLASLYNKLNAAEF